MLSHRIFGLVAHHAAILELASAFLSERCAQVLKRMIEIQAPLADYLKQRMLPQ